MFQVCLKIRPDIQTVTKTCGQSIPNVLVLQSKESIAKPLCTPLNAKLHESCINLAKVLVEHKAFAKLLFICKAFEFDTCSLTQDLHVPPVAITMHCLNICLEQKCALTG